MDGAVVTTVEDGVLSIVMNVPERLNAMDRRLLDGLEAGFARIDDPDVRVLLLTGRGRAFCAGADMRELAVDDDRAAARYVGQITRVIGQLRACPKPVVAGVQGYAVGGGAELALEADLFVLADDAIIRQPDVGIGSTPATAYRLVHLVGVALASRVVLGGQDLDASMARACGLVDELVAPADVPARAHQVAARLAGLSSLSTQYAKQALRLAVSTDGATDLRLNLAAELACYRSTEQREAVAAFLAR